MRYLIIALYVLCMATQPAAAECPCKELETRLSALGTHDISSVKDASAQVVALAQGQDDACREQLIYRFRGHFYNSLAAQDDRLDLSSLGEREAAELNQQLASAGWRLASSEGFYYVAELPGWSEAVLGSVLPPSYKKYFELRTREMKLGFSEDAGLLIPWDELRVRIVTWEDFLAQYPEFPEKSSIQEYIDIYVRVYLTGMDNSRAFGFEDQRLEAEVQKSYETFIRENSKSVYYPLISEYYGFLKKNDFVQPADLDEFLANKGYKSYLATQPPPY